MNLFTVAPKLLVTRTASHLESAMPTSRLAICAALFTLSLVADAANAAVILNNTSQGRYNASIGTVLDTNGVSDPFPCANVACGDATLSFPSAPNLSPAAGVLGNWLTTPATPGGTWTGVQSIPLSWAVNTETAIIYDINAGAGLDNLSLSLGVDNGIFVWLDGSYVFGARSAGGSALGEYVLSLSDLSAGTHYLQVLREDHGGGTGFDIRLTGDRVQVSEPGVLALLGIGLAGIGFSRRRKLA